MKHSVVWTLFKDIFKQKPIFELECNGNRFNLFKSIAKRLWEFFRHSIKLQNNDDILEFKVEWGDLLMVCLSLVVVWFV